MKKEYVVKTYKGKDTEENTKIFFDNEVWEYIDTAYQEGLKIAVFELGECLLDWS